MASPLGQLLCRNSYFLMKKLVQNKDIYWAATFWSRYFTQQELFQKKYFSNKATFSKRGTSSHGDMIYYYCIISLVFHLHIFQNSCFLEKANFSEKQYSESKFQRAPFSEWVIPNFSWQVLFQKGYFSKYTFLEEVLLRFLSTPHFLLIS